MKISKELKATMSVIAACFGIGAHFWLWNLIVRDGADFPHVFSWLILAVFPFIVGIYSLFTTIFKKDIVLS